MSDYERDEAIKSLAQILRRIVRDQIADDSAEEFAPDKAKHAELARLESIIAAAKEKP